MKMTVEQHRQRHLELHRALDELLADRIAHSRYPDVWLPSKASVGELMQWSHEQTLNPTEPPE